MEHIWATDHEFADALTSSANIAGVVLQMRLNKEAEFRQQHESDILVVQMGDFYEAVGQSAELLAGCGCVKMTRNHTLAGFPVYLLDKYQTQAAALGAKIHTIDAAPRNSKK